MENRNRPAHPLSGMKHQEEIGYGKTTEDYRGLTKREYFSAMAMQGLMYEFKEDKHELSICEDVARQALRMADELLKQLEK